MFLASTEKRDHHPPENILKINVLGGWMPLLTALANNMSVSFFHKNYCGLVFPPKLGLLAQTLWLSAPQTVPSKSLGLLLFDTKPNSQLQYMVTCKVAIKTNKVATWHIVSSAIWRAVTPGEKKIRHKQSDIVTERILQLYKQCCGHFLHLSVLIENTAGQPESHDGIHVHKAFIHTGL